MLLSSRYDFSCMPQKSAVCAAGEDDKTAEEKAIFGLMLDSIVDLYMTAQVLILLDGSYLSRFWTLTEAWCSMQQATTEGLRASKADEIRYTIMNIHNAEEEQIRFLEDKVRTKGPKEMYKMLAKPDVLVTNLKDKENILPKVKEFDTHAIEQMTAPTMVEPLAKQADEMQALTTHDRMPSP